MTEREVLEAAKNNVDAAMAALRECGKSYYADEVYVHLRRAMQTLEAGIRYRDMRIHLPTPMRR